MNKSCKLSTPCATKLAHIKMYIHFLVGPWGFSCARMKKADWRYLLVRFGVFESLREYPDRQFDAAIMFDRTVKLKCIYIIQSPWNRHSSFPIKIICFPELFEEKKNLAINLDSSLPRESDRSISNPTVCWKPTQKKLDDFIKLKAQTVKNVRFNPLNPQV